MLSPKSYALLFLCVFLCLFVNVSVMLKGVQCDCLSFLTPSLILVGLCIFCLLALLRYGSQVVERAAVDDQIYQEMKRIDVSKSVIRKVAHASSVFH